MERALLTSRFRVRWPGLSQVRRTEFYLPLSDRSHAMIAGRWVSGMVTDSGK